MIGNDIVDFQKAAVESNWLRKGYLDKLFCKEEQSLIFDSPDPNQIVWLLWSMKEAGYKIYCREKLVRTYQPKNIICSNLLIEENGASGHICYNDQNYYSRSILNTDFVHTSAVSNYAVFNNLHLFINSHQLDSNGLINVYNDQQFVSASCHLGYSLIKDKHNCPNLLNDETGEKRPISISHHGRFLSAVFLSNNNPV
jgi:phosphopantetheinyl transferase (holo-ACP synthase)